MKPIERITPIVRKIPGLVAAVGFETLFLSATAVGADAPRPPDGAAKPELAPLVLQLPAPMFKGTPQDLPAGPEIEPLSPKPRPPFLAPKGVTNVAFGKPVTSSVKPFTGDLQQITDGRKEPVDDDVVEMKRGTHYVQVDLGEEYALSAILMWHDHRCAQVMHDVVVQISGDPEFRTGVQTLFNNDTDNSSGLGAGTNREYIETHEGKLVDAGGAKARYVRCYTKGGSLSALNSWQEIEVYALPVR